MLSRTLEYTCQYSDQVRKKHKTWHDGKLKYAYLSRRLSLYSTMEGRKLLSSTFVTNQRELDKIIEPEGFNVNEHHVFGRFVVIITDLIREYDGAIEKEANPRTTKVSKPLKSAKQQSFLHNHRTSRPDGDPLALKMNKPFRPPRIITKQDVRPIVSSLNRPCIRSRVIEKSKSPAKCRQRIRRVCHEPIVF